MPKYYNAYVRQNAMRVRQMQVIYLNSQGVSYQDIALITDYALSTVYAYIRKFEDCMAEAVKLFANYELPPVERCYNYSPKGEDIVIPIEYHSNCGLADMANDMVYFLKFYLADGQVNTKIGTSTHNLERRICDEIRNYRKGNSKNEPWNIVKVEVVRAISVKSERQAEYAESYLRSVFGKKYDRHFMSHDRFLGVDIPVEEFDEAVNGYLN